MTAITAKIVNLDQFEAALKRLGSAARGQKLRDAAEAGARVIEANAKINIERTFTKHSQGGLAGSITVELSGDDKSAEAKIGPTVEYGRIQELGGVIQPVNAKKLVWVDPDTGEKKSAYLVTLPARPYLRPAVDEHEDEIEEAVAAQLKMGIEGAI